MTARGRAGLPAQGRQLRARGQHTVRRLLDAGLHVFAERGYHGARVDDIVAVAAASHGTFYLYFANKQDLFRCLALDVADEMSELVRGLGPLTADAAGYDALRAWIAGFADIHGRYGPIIRTWVEAEVDASELGELGTGLLGGFVGAIASRIRAAGAVGLDPTAAGLAVVALIERFHYYAISDQVAGDDDAFVDTLATVTFAALFGAAALPSRSRATRKRVRPTR